ncbi:unnamed protein product [Rotaria socialis]|uniref:Uncharacterized protein n=2 Tax=Rotaria socialis TaxID=392032 RepID=A0A821CH63_9BILA|nr:unnamed protein product [Rotaria socialis]CAF4608398.1 unnamed protein product [Rotaria socialis]
MNNYEQYANMNKDTKDRMCNHNNIEQAYEQIKFSSMENNNKNVKSSLKRTERKMDENQPQSDNNSAIGSEIDDSQWQYQRKSNKRVNKEPRINSFVRGRTITSTSHGYGRTEKNITRHPPPQYEEKKIERKIDSHQLSNCECQQQNVQYLGAKCVNRTMNKLTVLHRDNHPIDGNDEIYVTRQAMKFAVEDRFSPLKIHSNPGLKNHEEGESIVKEFIKHIERNFKKLSPYFNQPLGFDHYIVDNKGSLICFTKYIELFIYICDLNNYPKDFNNIILSPVLPIKLPAHNVIMLKFIDNTIIFDDIKTHVKEKLKSVYTMEEMMGTMNYRSRHIRIDLLSKDEYKSVLNSGKIALGGHLYDVDEYLPSPRILICNKRNSPGHLKKNCKSIIELCKRCGNDRNDGADHKNCNIKRHHCSENHEAASFKCAWISKFRQDLLLKLKENKHLLPRNIQFYIPQQYRDHKGEKALMNNSVENYHLQTQH